MLLGAPPCSVGNRLYAQGTTRGDPLRVFLGGRGSGDGAGARQANNSSTTTAQARPSDRRLAVEQCGKRGWGGGAVAGKRWGLNEVRVADGCPAAGRQGPGRGGWLGGDARVGWLEWWIVLARRVGVCRGCGCRIGGAWLCLRLRHSFTCRSTCCCDPVKTTGALLDAALVTKKPAACLCAP